jgi:hypothetical protein
MSHKLNTDSGDKTNLPDFVRDIAKPRSEVVAWSHLDPDLEAELGKFAFFIACGPCEYRAGEIYILCLDNDIPDPLFL